MNVELTNMCMVYDRASDRLLAERREKKGWPGVCFPGGHVDPGESLYASAVREVWEETGLTVSDLKFCGIVHWDNLDTGDRYIVYLYRTETYSGTLRERSEEGEVFWVDRKEFPNLDLAENFGEQYQMFWRDEIGEMHIPNGSQIPTFQYEIF